MFIATSVLFAFALVLVFYGLRGRGDARVGPRCASCGYDLRGRVAESKRCPECGAELDRVGAIVSHRRRRRPVVIVFGLLLLLCSIGLFTAAKSGWLNLARINRLTPTAILLWRVEHESTASAASVMDLLLGRLRNEPERFSADQRLRLLRDLVDAQADPRMPWQSWWGETVDVAYSNGTLPPELLNRYLDEIASSVDLVLDPPVLAPGKLIEAHYQLRPARMRSPGEGRTMGGAMPVMWATQNVRYTMTLEGIEVGSSFGFSFGDGFLFQGFRDKSDRRSFGVISRTPRNILDRVKPGEHVLEVELTMDIVDSAHRERGVLHHTRRRLQIPVTLSASPATQGDD